MCGRYALASDKTTLSMTFPELNIPANLPSRYNIEPTQPVPVVANNQGREVEAFHWGLIPFWAKDSAIGNKLINARAETLNEKPSFKHAFRRRRCLLLADGFYEWYRVPDTKTKIPVRIHMVDCLPFAFAGLWESWRQADGESLQSCTIITTEPNELMAKVHNRMPVILEPDDYNDWLDPRQRTPESLGPLLKPFDPEKMTAYPVSTMVNNPAMDSLDCIEPDGEADFL